MSILTHRCCAIAFLIPTSLCALEPNAFFEKRVRPVLVKRCYRCHGPESKKRGDLRLDSRAALLKGGISGSALKPGKPQESLLIQALSHQKKLKMPPNKRLSSREISDLTAWVKMGAPWPDNGSKFTKAERNYWAFQPIQNPKLPRVKSTTWCQSPIDHFILSKLEKQGLKPAPRADRRTLIRRVTFDLIGLPPTPREVQSFIEDRSPNAFAKVIDRLLASPAYGEKWGRHWLDVARYADSNGMDENLAQANAYHYRDYVIRSWNRDKPYNEFVRAQIAGDLMWKERV